MARETQSLGVPGLGGMSQVAEKALDSPPQKKSMADERRAKPQGLARNPGSVNIGRETCMRESGSPIQKTMRGMVRKVRLGKGAQIGQKTREVAGETQTRAERPVIYQVLPRLFGNENARRKPWGTRDENGCGHFSDFNPQALRALREFGATHLWLTGVLEQASGTSYPHRPADPPDLLKGIAGSPYAVRDCFDVCPDYAVDPARRLKEFRELLVRCHGQGLRVIIDFVPNHVARNHASDVRPELDLGRGDDPSLFCGWNNNFYYIQPGMAPGGPPLKLPTAGAPGCTGRFAGETDFVRVTGNNAVTFAPGGQDWYETVKLNYGHDFTRGPDSSHLPGAEAGPEAVPDTWRKMEAVLAHWQEMGVAGFRVDMAHMVPVEFWRWAIRRARQRDPELLLVAEAYDNDPAKLGTGNVLDALLEAGFDAVYDDACYKLCQGIFSGPGGGVKWANDLDTQIFTGARFHRSLRYAENHDEVRLASPREWGGWGMRVGRPVSASLFGMGRGPLLIYHGQEVGEPALGAAGFSGDDGRTTIFDYWSMPEFCKWVNGKKFDGGGLNEEQKHLRKWYARLLKILRERAFVEGDFYALNHANLYNPQFGRTAEETVSGHWLHAYLRQSQAGGQCFLVVSNFHPGCEWSDARIRLPWEALDWLGVHRGRIRLAERLGPEWSATAELRTLPAEGIMLPPLPPLDARMMELTVVDS